MRAEHYSIWRNFLWNFFEFEFQMKYTNSLVNADSFYTNFTNTTFQKISIPHLTRTYYETEITSLMRNFLFFINQIPLYLLNAIFG